jgi:hypothetical protein
MAKRITVATRNGLAMCSPRASFDRAGCSPSSTGSGQNSNNSGKKLLPKIDDDTSLDIYRASGSTQRRCLASKPQQGKTTCSWPEGSITDFRQEGTGFKAACHFPRGADSQNRLTGAMADGHAGHTHFAAPPRLWASGVMNVRTSIALWT